MISHKKGVAHRSHRFIIDRRWSCRKSLWNRVKERLWRKWRWGYIICTRRTFTYMFNDCRGTSTWVPLFVTAVDSTRLPPPSPLTTCTHPLWLISVFLERLLNMCRSQRDYKPRPWQHNGMLVKSNPIATAVDAGQRSAAHLRTTYSPPQEQSFHVLPVKKFHLLCHKLLST